MSTDNESDHPGSHAANQHKTEPMPPTQGHGDPDAAPGPAKAETPDLASMNVDANDPQAPSRDGAAGATAQPSLSDTPAEQQTGGVPVGSAYPAEGSSEELPIAQGTRPPR